jgi:transcription-repair coupling factor (superfamily II helicase)
MFDKIFDLSKDKEIISGLNLELKAIYINELYKKYNKNILLVSNNYYNSSKIYNTILNHNENSYFYPMDDFYDLNIESVSPELEIIRSTTINSTFSDKKGVYVTDLKGYIKKIMNPNDFLNLKISLKVEEEVDLNEISKKLFEMGYSKESLVTKKGEFAQRGFVLDIFPIDGEPIRVEFWGEQIVNIKTFDIDSQRSVSEISKITINPFKNNIGKIEDSSIKDYISDCLIIFDEYSKIKMEYNELIKKENFDDNYSSFDLSNKHLKFDNINDLFDNANYINYNSKLIFNIDKEHESFVEKLSNLNKTVFLCFDNTKVLNRFNKESKKEYKLSSFEDYEVNKINLINFKINESFEIQDYIFISEKTLLNKKEEKVIVKSANKISKRISDLTKLEIGDYVVHDRYGIGIYNGLKTISKGDFEKDYIQINYKGTDKLYIPVEKIDLISKFSSKEGYEPRINKLGSLEWEKAKLSARNRAKSIAIDLLKLYSERENSIGHSFSKDTEEQLIFESEFPFDETKDQIKAIEEVKSDMERKRPMDRIICGDVGFGKTEVAFKAMFKAVMDSKQVIFLCPTTILSRQHYLNAIERFKTFPIKIELINRFVSSKKKKEIIEDFQKGKIDILIGTHRVLSKDIKPKDLGLLVIDEEQRFGVTHKEKIKEYKNNIDILTLSATPIPRTVQMSLSGIKNLSLIETPPVNRVPIQTYVLEENESVIKTAIYQEISRGGQVFILSNQVKGIENKLIEISKLVPEAKVCFAHGRLNKVELEDVMIKFINKDYNVLISTTIIETGIDIPSANTLIILDADKFGLSQLYQIRGRVGRSNQTAYCFLMYKRGKTITDIAVKRLKAIKEFTELGSGFAIAMRDLSIRGAGDILGSEQAGFIDTVGIELFIKMLNKEVEKLKGNIVSEDEEDKPLIDVATSIDDKFISDEDIKIEIHKKINSINSYEKLIQVKEELIDRFGNISEQLEIYMNQELFEKYAQKIGIREIRQNKREIEIVLSKEQTNKINGEKLFLEIISKNANVRFNMKFKRLAIIVNLLKQEKHYIYTLLDIIKAIESSLV